MIEADTFFYYLLVIGIVGGLIFKPYGWPEASIINATAGASLGASIVSLCTVVLYGLAPKDVQQDLIVKILCFIFPILGAISYMRFMRDYKK